MTGIEPYRPAPTTSGGRPSTEQLVLRWLTTKRSGHTRSSYGRDLGVQVPRPGVTEPGESRPGKAPAWLTYCASIGLDPLGGVLEEHVALWARGMEAAGLTPATVARRIAAVSSWYSWLARHKHVAVNPAAELARPYVDPDISKTPGLTKEQALALMAYADSATTPQAQRNAAMAAVLLYTGARVSEATGATMADLGTDRGHRVLWVTRKGGARQPLVLPPPALARLDAYFTVRDDLEHLPALPGQVATGSRPLIATDHGRRMRDADVWSLMRRLAKGAGLPADLAGKLGAHGMRHTFGTLALDAGVPLRDLQDAMGHKDPRTTRRYDQARGRLDRSPGYALASYLASE
jgi:site-specific recombinase XerD